VGEKSRKGREGIGTGEGTKKAEPVRARLGIGKEWRLVSVEFAI
jgi:hypothetical protein